MTARLLRQHGFLIAHKPATSLRNTLSHPKDRKPVFETSNVVYKINCGQCTSVYVGQTGKNLSKRLHEHQLATKRHDALSQLSAHQDHYDHKFDFESTTIVARAPTRSAREFLEAWHSGPDAINRHVEMDPIYEVLTRKPTSNSTVGRPPPGTT